MVQIAPEINVKNTNRSKSLSHPNFVTKRVASNGGVTSEAQIVMLANAGASTLEIASIAITGMNATSYSRLNVY
jgi:hypothetical protein